VAPKGAEYADQCSLYANLPSRFLCLRNRPFRQNFKDDVVLYYSPSSATTLLPGQDKLAPSCPLSEESSFVVSCGVRLSEVGLEIICKPQVARSIRVAGSIVRKAVSTIMMFGNALAPSPLR
jgi:hypothetical protein